MNADALQVAVAWCTVLGVPVSILALYLTKRSHDEKRVADRQAEITKAATAGRDAMRVEQAPVIAQLQSDLRNAVHDRDLAQRDCETKELRIQQLEDRLMRRNGHEGN